MKQTIKLTNQTQKPRTTEALTAAINRLAEAQEKANSLTEQMLDLNKVLLSGKDN